MTSSNKSLYVFILFLFTFASIQSQENIRVEYGDVFKHEKREIPVNFLGKDDSAYYLLYAEGRFGQGDEMTIRKFNLDLTPTNTEISLKHEVTDGKFNSLGVTKLKNNIIHVYYVLTDTGKKFYYQTVSLDDFTLGEQHFISEIEHDTKNALYAISRFLISDDEETVTLFYTIPNKNKELAKIRVQTFDANFNEKTSNDFEFQFQNKFFGIHNIFINKQNEMFLLCKKINNVDDPIIKNRSYEFHVYKIIDSSINLITTVTPEKGVNLRFLTPTFSTDNNVFLTGLTSKRNIYAMSGIYAAKVNLDNGEKLYETYNSFDPYFITQLAKSGKKKDRLIKKVNEGKYEDPNYILSNVIADENDELLVLAEQLRSYTYNYVTTYYNNNIAALRLNNKGEVVWKNKIGKRQEKTNVNIYNSYLV